MMKFLINILLFLVFAVNLYSSDWELTFDIGSAFIRGIVCHDTNNTFMGLEKSGEYYLFRSSNKGKTWKEIYKPSIYSRWTDIDSYDSPDPMNHYFGTRHRNIIRYSNDGGNSFDSTFINYDSTINDIESGWYKGVAISDIEMYNGQTGIALLSDIDSVYITHDGWKTFKSVQFFDPKIHLDSPVFLDSSTVLFQVAGYLKRRLFEYDIYKNEWDFYHEFENDTLNYGQDLFQGRDIVNDSLWFMAARRSTGLRSTEISVIYKSTTAGKYWKRIHYHETGMRLGLYDIEFYDENNGVAVGKGRILLTKDGGDTWYYDELPDEAVSFEFFQYVVWIGKTPLIGSDNQVFRYVGDFFDFEGNDKDSVIFTGKVLFSDGMPLSDITVAAGDFTTYTDSSGFYALKNLDTGRYKLFPSAREYRYEPEEYDIQITDSNVIHYYGREYNYDTKEWEILDSVLTTQELNFTVTHWVDRLATFKGRVTIGDSDKGLANVFIWYDGYSENFNKSPHYVAYTDSMGYYTIEPYFEPDEYVMFTPVSNPKSKYTFEPEYYSFTVRRDTTGLDFKAYLTTNVEYEEENIPIDIYPNPANNFLNIKSEVPLSKVQIFNLETARPVNYEYSLDRLDIRDLPTGAYAIVFFDLYDEMYIKKFVKE